MPLIKLGITGCLLCLCACAGVKNYQNVPGPDRHEYSEIDNEMKGFEPPPSSDQKPFWP